MRNLLKPNLKSAASLTATALLLSVLSFQALSEAPTSSEEHRYTFSWPYAEDDKMKPRGGTTVGAPLKLAKSPTQSWKRLQESHLSKKAKDRLAILSMQGPYRASFDFLESV